MDVEGLKKIGDAIKKSGDCSKKATREVATYLSTQDVFINAEKIIEACLQDNIDVQCLIDVYSEKKENDTKKALWYIIA